MSQPLPCGCKANACVDGWIVAAVSFLCDAHKQGAFVRNEWSHADVLREIRGGYDDYYSTGDLTRLLNGERLIRGLIPPLGDS